MQFTHSGKPRRHRDRVTRKRTRLVDTAERRNLLHNVEAPAVCTYGHTAADNLPEGREIGLDAVKPLRAVDTHAETRHDLVYNQEGTVFLGFCGKRLQELGLRGHHTHIPCHRFHDDTRNLVANLVEKFLDTRHVVVLERERVLREVGRHPLAARLAGSKHARTRLDKQAIAMAVVAALELHNLVAAVNPRAARIALIVASVPLFTMRIISTLGTRLITSFASSDSSPHGAPKLRPFFAVSATAVITASCAWPKSIGPQLPT